ncbi:MAG: MOSC domain-containing protein [Opitutales bacterium]
MGTPHTPSPAEPAQTAVPTPVEIRHIWVSGGHDFFGRHGQDRHHHPARPVDSVQCHAGRGLVGDRFYDFKADYKGQVTFFQSEVAEAVRDFLKTHTLDASRFRRNVLIEGIDLNRLIGATFHLAGVTFQGVEESRPCHWMDQAVGPGVHAFLKGRGGLRARVLTSGVLRCGPVHLRLDA